MTKLDAQQKAKIPKKWFNSFMLFMELWHSEYAHAKGWGIGRAMGKRLKLDSSGVTSIHFRNLEKAGLIKRLSHGKCQPTAKGSAIYKLAKD